MKNSIYLDNAASSFPKPKSVVKAVASAIDAMPGNAGRGYASGSLTLARMVFDTREAISRLLGLPHSERIVFTRNATEGLNIALKGLLKKGDTVLISALEHHSVIRPLTALQKKGVKVEIAPLTRDGLPDPKKLPPAKALVVTGASNVTGAISNIKALGKACRRNGTRLIVDAAQSAGSIEFDTSNISALACTGHKGLLGPQGIGFVWFADGVEPDILLEGGTGSDSASNKMPLFWPDRFEAGTMNGPGIAGLKAGVNWLIKKGVDAVREREALQNSMIMEALMNNKRIEVYPPFDPAKRASLITFNVKGYDPSEIGARLDKKGVACRVGLHCAPDAHKFLGTFPMGALRVSPGALTKMKDVKEFLEILGKIVES